MVPACLIRSVCGPCAKTRRYREVFFLQRIVLELGHDGVTACARPAAPPPWFQSYGLSVSGVRLAALPGRGPKCQRWPLRRTILGGATCLVAPGTVSLRLPAPPSPHAAGDAPGTQRGWGGGLAWSLGVAEAEQSLPKAAAVELCPRGGASGPWALSGVSFEPGAPLLPLSLGAFLFSFLVWGPGHRLGGFPSCWDPI